MLQLARKIQSQMVMEQKLQIGSESTQSSYYMNIFWEMIRTKSLIFIFVFYSILILYIFRSSTVKNLLYQAKNYCFSTDPSVVRSVYVHEDK